MTETHPYTKALHLAQSGEEHDFVRALSANDTHWAETILEENTRFLTDDFGTEILMSALLHASEDMLQVVMRAAPNYLFWRGNTKDPEPCWHNFSVDAFAMATLPPDRLSFLKERHLIRPQHPSKNGALDAEIFGAFFHEHPQFFEDFLTSFEAGHTKNLDDKTTVFVYASLKHIVFSWERDEQNTEMATRGKERLQEFLAKHAELSFSGPKPTWFSQMTETSVRAAEHYQTAKSLLSFMTDMETFLSGHAPKNFDPFSDINSINNFYFLGKHIAKLHHDQMATISSKVFERGLTGDVAAQSLLDHIFRALSANKLYMKDIPEGLVGAFAVGQFLTGRDHRFKLARERFALSASLPPWSTGGNELSARPARKI